MDLIITINYGAGAIFTMLLFHYNLKMGVAGDNVTLLKAVNTCQ
jgi:hypothetical protein